MTTLTPKNHFRPLTSLRFFAAMHVLAFHNHLDALMDLPGGIRSIIRTGYVSVSLFFVLSGFILAYTYHGDREGVSFDRRSFWAARLARIYPVYLVGLLLAALIVGAALMMKVDTPLKIYGYPAIAIIFFLLAAIGALVLVFNIMFRDEKHKGESSD